MPCINNGVDTDLAHVASSGGGPSNPPQPSPQLTPAAPPSRLEIERKLSFKSAAAPRNIETPRKTKVRDRVRNLLDCLSK